MRDINPSRIEISGSTVLTCSQVSLLTILLSFPSLPMSNITAFVLQEKDEPNGAISFNDMQNRLSISYRRTVSNDKGSTWSVFDQTGLGGGAFVPVFMLEFGRDHSLGVIHTGPKECMSIRKYLSKATILGKWVPTRCLFDIRSPIFMSTVRVLENSKPQIIKSIRGVTVR